MAMTETLLGMEPIGHDRDPAPANRDVAYLASYTCSQFHQSSDFVRGLVGPLGSGKSVACCAELMRLAHAQEPSPHDGIIRGRGCVVRNTYRELADTTIRTWSDWFPAESVGRWDQQNMTLHITSPGMHPSYWSRPAGTSHQQILPSIAMMPQPVVLEM